MDVKFNQDTGRILSCTIEGKIERAEDVLTINDAALPKDFVAMFPLGKYLVKKGAIVESKKFVMPKIRPRDLADEI